MLLPISLLEQFVTVSEPIEAIADRFVSLGFEAEPVSKQLIDLEVTPNRGDVLSIIGLAREYAASTNQSVKSLDIKPLVFAPSLSEFDLRLQPSAYHRLSAVIIKGIKNGPSPSWLVKSLELCDINSINLIVDLTNYVMIELGIPLHAFDLKKLPAKSFTVRVSVAGEKFTSLKNEQLTLPPDAIVAESGGQIVDLVGIRGGQQAMIDDTTTDILLWAVSLPRPLIRQTVKATGLRTEGSYRHERETDWEMLPNAISRATSLMVKIGDGEAGQAAAFSSTVREDKKISFQLDDINALLGTKYSADTVNSALSRLGFSISEGMVTVPSWRYTDIDSWHDLAEEVARVEGYDNLPSRLISKEDQTERSWYAKLENLKDQLVGEGFCEVYSESFAGSREVQLGGFDESNLARLSNPVNQEFAVCRPTMVFNLFKLLALNSWSDDARVFEIGKVFPALDLEINKIAIAVYGKQIEALSKWVPTESIEVINPDHSLAKHYKLRKTVTIGEVALDQLKVELVPDFVVLRDSAKYQPVSVFPPSVRDISIIVNQSVAIEDIKQAVLAIAPINILSVELFDQFKNDRFGPNNYSLSFHVVYQSLERTLQQKEVDDWHNQVLARLVEKFNAVVR